MQCQSYFPVCHSHYDLNVDPNGSARPMYNNNGSLPNRHGTSYVSSSSPIQQRHYGKEFLRQTMIVQELTFRDQVQELHRLYRKQKELMNEIRNKEMFMGRLHLETQCSNSISKFLPNCGQNSQNNLGLPYSFQDQRIVDATVSKGNDNKNNLQFLESKCKKIGGKLLDLELPAEVYIDCEDQESVEDAQLCDAPTSASSSNKCNSILADLNKSLTASQLGDTDKIPNKLKILETTQIVNGENERSDATNIDKAKHVSVGSCQETRCSNMEKNGFVVQALPCSTNQTEPGKGVKGGRIRGLIDESRSLKSVSCKSKLKESMASKSLENCGSLRNGFSGIDLNSDVSNAEFTPFNDISSRKAVIELNISDLSEVPFFEQDSVDDENNRKFKKCKLIDINLPCEEDEPLTEDDLDQHDFESVPLNNINDDDGSPLKSTKKDKVSIKIDLEAPPSLEVEEGPPRVDLEENLHKVTLSDDSSVELDKVAAEIIVSMSLSKLQPCSDTRDLCTLEWFADIIHSISVDPTFGLDDFEAMTLNLTEMKVEEHWSHDSAPSENLTGSTSPSSQTRKGRTRSKKKDFQREVLPSLTSLSRYEVTEDIQMIEGLMEANGTPWQLCKTRRASRTGRKSRTVEHQSSIVGVVDSKCDRTLVSWGKVPRRARGHRSPVNPSKWLEIFI